jgi:hypothetical protein
MHSPFFDERLLALSLRCVVDDQSITEQKRYQRNESKCGSEFVFRFQRAQEAPGDKECENQHQEIEENKLHSCTTPYKEMKLTGIQWQFSLYSLAHFVTSRNLFVTKEFTISTCFVYSPSMPHSFSPIHMLHRSCSTMLSCSDNLL